MVSIEAMSAATTAWKLVSKSRTRDGGGDVVDIQSFFVFAFYGILSNNTKAEVRVI